MLSWPIILLIAVVIYGLLGLATSVVIFKITDSEIDPFDVIFSLGAGFLWPLTWLVSLFVFLVTFFK